MSQLNGAPPPFFSAGEKVFVNRARSVFGIFLGTREKRRVGGGRLVVTKPPHSRSSETDFVFACRPLALAFFRPHLRPCDSSVQTDSLQPAASSQPSQQHIRPDFVSEMFTRGLQISDVSAAMVVDPPFTIGNATDMSQVNASLMLARVRTLHVGVGNLLVPLSRIDPLSDDPSFGNIVAPQVMVLVLAIDVQASGSTSLLVETVYFIHDEEANPAPLAHAQFSHSSLHRIDSVSCPFVYMATNSCIVTYGSALRTARILAAGGPIGIPVRLPEPGAAPIATPALLGLESPPQVPTAPSHHNTTKEFSLSVSSAQHRGERHPPPRCQV